ncbi:MAG: hypothetical protein EXR51_07825 [Dehalococcoidia bacterium]|nr:hypothetical protein [Dehalococcoidia bacterium]
MKKARHAIGPAAEDADDRMTAEQSVPAFAGSLPIDPEGASERVVAVIDIGSNSGRVMVLRRTEQGHLEVIDDERAPLRLVAATEQGGRRGVGDRGPSRLVPSARR